MFFGRRQQRQLDRELISAIKQDDADEVRSLLARGADPNARDTEAAQEPTLLVVFRRDTVTFPPSYPGGRAESFYSIEVNQAILAALLECGGNANIRNRLGDTPLSLAAEWHDLSTVELLLRHGADPNYPGEDGVTALMAAVLFDSNPEPNHDVIRALLDAGANVNAQEPEEGNTALMYAVGNGSIDLIRLVLDNGANVNLRDTQGATAFTVARRASWNRARPEVIALLERAGAEG